MTRKKLIAELTADPVVKIVMTEILKQAKLEMIGCMTDEEILAWISPPSEVMVQLRAELNRQALKRVEGLDLPNLAAELLEDRTIQETKDLRVWLRK